MKDSIEHIEIMVMTCISASVIIAYESDLKGFGVDGEAKIIGCKKMRNFCCFIEPDNDPTRSFHLGNIILGRLLC